MNKRDQFAQTAPKLVLHVLKVYPVLTTEQPLMYYQVGLHLQPFLGFEIMNSFAYTRTYDLALCLWEGRTGKGCFTFIEVIGAHGMADECREVRNLLAAAK